MAKFLAQMSLVIDIPLDDLEKDSPEYWDAVWFCTLDHILIDPDTVTVDAITEIEDN